MTLALAVRLSLWAVLPGQPQRAFVNEDARQYQALARNLWAHGVFSDSPAAPFEPNFLRSPLYPAFIAAIGGPTGSWVLLPCLGQVLLGCWTVLLLVRVADQLLQFPRAVVIGLGTLGAIDPNSAAFCGMLMSETVFAALWTAATAAVLWMVKTGRFRVGYPAMAALLTAATFTRPIAQFALPVFLILSVIFLHRKGRSVSRQLPMVLVALAIFVGPFFGWIVRNRRAGGPTAFTMAGNYNLFVYGCRMASHARGHRDWPTVKREWRAELNQLQHEYVSPAERHEVLGRRGWSLLAKHWPQSLREFCVGVPRTFRSLAYEVFLYLGYTDRQIPPLSFSALRGQWPQTPLLVALRVGFIVALLLIYAKAGVGLVLAWRQWRSPEFLIVLTGLAYLTILGAFNSGGRFRVPMTAALLWLLGFGYSEIYRRWKARHRDRPRLTGTETPA